MDIVKQDQVGSVRVRGGVHYCPLLPGSPSFNHGLHLRVAPESLARLQLCCNLMQFIGEAGFEISSCSSAGKL